VNHGGQREIALARQFHAEKRGANDRYLVNPIIRWRGREWRLRVDLTRLTREHLNGRNRRILPIPARSGGGRLTERTPAVQPRQREQVKVR
jgi:hypothetical protein